MRSVFAAASLVLTLSIAGQSVDFPPGTTQFFSSRAAAAVAAPDGGVWVATTNGVVRYTEAGPGTLLPVSGGPPQSVTLAADGSIWVSNATRIVRMSSSGTTLEEYAMPRYVRLAVASDGALWYWRPGVGGFLGRIAGGVTTALASPVDAWSVAPAAGGDVWILGSGLATATDTLYRMTPTGVVTTLPLG